MNRAQEVSSKSFLNDPLVVRARDRAELLFRDVKRKSGGAPYFSHLEHVAHLAAEYSDVPEVIAAAYLHDAVEDEMTTAEEIEREFGERVLELVLSVTEQKDVGTWESRKAAYVAQIDNVQTAVIAGADKVDNLNGLLEVTDWAVFNNGPQQKLAHYRHVGEAVQRLVPALGDRVLKLCDALGTRLNYR